MLAKRLSREGFFVYAACRDASCEGALELSKYPNLHVLQMDVTKDNEIDDALSLVKSNLGTKVLWAVVANAGFASVGLVEWQSMQSIRNIFNINVFGTVNVCKKFLPLLRKSRGRVILVSSVLGRTTLPYGTSYSMTKHALTSLADGLRRECFDQGVDVATIEPVMYNTKLIAPVGSKEALQQDLALLPTEVREEYSEPEVLHWVHSSSVLKMIMSRKNVNGAIDQMILSVRESEPKPYYFAWAPLDSVIYFVLWNTPAEFFDAMTIILRKFVRWFYKYSDLPNL
ncbi:dehydrogenase/reductase SDR family member 9-like [Haemaphysalis longicornis]